MASIELHGLVRAVIITQLGSLSIKTALTENVGMDRENIYSGNISCELDGKRYEGATVRVPRGYLLHTQCVPIGLTYPLYISTSGSVLRNVDLDYYFTYSKKGHEAFGFLLVDNSLILHGISGHDFTPVTSLACSGEMRAKQSRNLFPVEPVRLDGKNKGWRECGLTFNGHLGCEAGISGEIMELTGTFKLKPWNGEAKREAGLPYKLRGDWEAVLRGHVVAEVGSVSISNSNEFTPSFVRVFARGELVKAFGD